MHLSSHKNILLEASGTLVSSYLIKTIQDAGHRAISSDINTCAAEFFADNFLIMPNAKDPELWEKMEEIIKRNQIHLVIPTQDETILGWVERKTFYK